MSKSYILMGDPHATISNCHHLSKVIDFAIENKKDATSIVLLGDLFDTHAVVRNEISYFWEAELRKLTNHFEQVICLVGNHDQAGNKEKEHIHSLWPYSLVSPKIIIVDKPTYIDNMAFFPYTATEEKFLEWAKEAKNNKCKTIFAHQTFDGAQYDNGMYTPDGFSLENLSDFNIISGHIHTQSEFANVWYTGTSTWESVSDFNVPKGIWNCTFFDGICKKREFLSTAEVVPEMVGIELKELDENVSSIIDALELKDNKKYFFHFIGSSSWVGKMKKKFSKYKHKSTYIDSALKKANKQNSFSSIEDFVKKQNFKTSPDEIIRYIKTL
jgi:hypothetical protein